MSWLVSNSIVALAASLVVWAIGRLGKPAPVVMHVLWLFVLLKLITPPLFEVPVWSVSVAMRPVEAAAPDAAAGDLPRDETIAAADIEAPSRQAGSHIEWSDVMSGIWLCGSVAFVVWLGVGVVRARRRIVRLPPAPQWLRREVEHLARQLDVRVPELLDDPSASAPCVWSLGGVRMLLPAHTLAAASRKGRSSVIAHELAHLRRGDHWVAHVELALAVVLWWHPLFWLARTQLRDWAELACDAWAVASVPDATLDYATVLVDAVARPDSAVPGMTVLAARPAARAAFERRLVMILNENVPCRASRGWWLPFGAMGAVLFAVPVVAQQQEPVRIEIKVNGKDLKDLDAAHRAALVKKVLHESSGGGEATPQEPVPPKPPKETRKLTKRVEGSGSGADVHEALEKALDQAKAEVSADPDLRKLGLTEDVAKLIDQAMSGKDIQKQVDDMVKKAMHGALRTAVAEIHGDPELRDLGITDDVEKLVTGLMHGEDGEATLRELMQKIGDKGSFHVGSGAKSAHDSHSAHDESHQESHQESHSSSSDSKKAESSDGADAKEHAEKSDAGDKADRDEKSDKDSGRSKGKKKNGKHKK